jgi:glycosyltransferase involved in cell wall biosynthesis
MSKATAPPVSVVIPTYNRAKTILRAALSVLNQTFGDIELIIVDDGSTDETLETLRKINDPRMKVLRHERNAGGAAARNTGIKAARGLWVAFQDSDDEWLITKLERQLAALHDAPDLAAVYCGKVVCGRDEQHRYGSRRSYIMPPPEYNVVSGNLYDVILKSALISTQTLLVSRQKLIDIGGFDERLRIGQDWDLTLRLSQITPIGFVDEPLVFTTIMGDSISQVKINQYMTRRIVYNKHKQRINSDSALRYEFEYAMGSILQRHGIYSGARKHLIEAARANPGNLKTWARLFLSLVKPDTGTLPGHIKEALKD